MKTITKVFLTAAAALVAAQSFASNPYDNQLTSCPSSLSKSGTLWTGHFSGGGSYELPIAGSYFDTLGSFINPPEGSYPLEEVTVVFKTNARALVTAIKCQYKSDQSGLDGPYLKNNAGGTTPVYKHLIAQDPSAYKNSNINDLRAMCYTVDHDCAFYVSKTKA